MLCCLAAQLSQAGRGQSTRTVSRSTSTRELQRRLPRAATALAGPRPAKCEKFCSLRLRLAPNKRFRFHHDQREKGVPDPHSNRADIIGGLSLAAYKVTHATRRVLLSSTNARTRLQPAATPGTNKDETDKEIHNATYFQVNCKHCRPLEPTMQQSCRTISKANITSPNQTRAPHRVSHQHSDNEATRRN